MDRMHEWITTGERPALPLYVSPFAKSASGSSSKEGDEDEDDGDEDDAEEDEEDDDPDADKSDEEIRAELKAVREQLKKANNSSAKRRRALREKEAELDAERKKRVAKPKGKADDEEDEGPDLDEIRREAAAPALLRAKKAEAKTSLLAAGVNPARVAKAVGLLDLDELDLDDDGLDGIDDAIEALREEWPEMFASKRKRRDSVAGGGDRDGKAAPKKTLSPSERQALALTGRSR